MGKWAGLQEGLHLQNIDSSVTNGAAAQAANIPKSPTVLLAGPGVLRKSCCAPVIAPAVFRTCGYNRAEYPVARDTWCYGRLLIQKIFRLTTVLKIQLVVKPELICQRAVDFIDADPGICKLFKVQLNRIFDFLEDGHISLPGVSRVSRIDNGSRLSPEALTKRLILIQQELKVFNVFHRLVLTAFVNTRRSGNRL